MMQCYSISGYYTVLSGDTGNGPIPKLCKEAHCTMSALPEFSDTSTVGTKNTFMTTPTN